MQRKDTAYHNDDLGDLCGRHLVYPVNDHKGLVKVMV